MPHVISCFAFALNTVRTKWSSFSTAEFRTKMYFKQLILLCTVYVLSVQSFDFFGINDGYRRLMKEIKSIAILTGAPIFTRWIDQNLDHYDKNETRKWKMRYFERLDYWRPKGPVYLFLGGESPAEPGFLTTGIVYDLAKETNGAMFMSEHRYYGESQPVSRSNLEDMKFLSATQALADNAHLLRTIKRNILFKNSKIVVVGGSYAGNLAAWMKLIYPELVDAAIASSGPVLAKRDFYEYLEVVNNDYDQYGSPGCLENIQNIFQRYDTLFKTDEGIKQLKEEENICDKTDIAKPENKQLFFLMKASNFMSNAQYGTTKSIRNHCSKLNKTHDALLTEDKQYYWNEKRDCYDYDFNNMIQEYHEDENDWILCWTYQTCNEFGYFQSTTSDDQPFTKNIPVELYDKLCSALFGEGFDKDRVNIGVEKINEMYKAKSPNVTEVVFVNGELDPWSALGVLEDISYDAPAVYIPRSSHCRDLFSNSKGDHEELKQARTHIKYLIKKWIGAGDYIIN